MKNEFGPSVPQIPYSIALHTPRRDRLSQLIATWSFSHNYNACKTLMGSTGDAERSIDQPQGPNNLRSILASMKTPEIGSNLRT